MTQLPPKTSPKPAPISGYSITQAAAKINVHPKTLRRWEQAGKFTPQRTLGNQRRYSSKDLNQLQAIKSGQLTATSPADKLLTTDQVAQKLHVSPATIRRWTREGKLKLTVDNQLNQGYSEASLNQFLKTSPPTSPLTPEPPAPPSPTPPSKTPSLPDTISWLKHPKLQKAFVYGSLTALFLSVGLLTYLYLKNPDKLASPTVQQADVSQDIEVVLPRVGSFLDGRITIGSDTGDLSFLDAQGNIYAKNAALIENSLHTRSLQLLPSSQPEAQIGRQYVDQATGDLMYFDGLGWTSINQTTSSATLQGIYDTGDTTLIAEDQNIDITLGNSAASGSATSINFTLAGPNSTFKVLGGASQTVLSLDDDSIYPVSISQPTQITANLSASQFIDSDSATYYLDPGNTTTSLNVAGDATILETLTFSQYSETLSNSTDGYLVSSTGLAVGDDTTYYFNSDGDLKAHKLDVSSTLNADGQVDLGDGGDLINIHGNAIYFKTADDTDNYAYFSTTSDAIGLYFEGYTANDPAIRINPSTDELEYRDENESTWTSLDSGGGGGGGSVWTDGGTYVYPTGYESIRVYDSAGSDYVQFQHDGTDLNLTSSGTTAINLNDTLDLQNNLITNIGNAGTDFTSSGGLTLAGDVVIGDTTAHATLDIDGSANQVHLIIQANATQATNILEIQNSSNDVLSGVDERGILFSDGNIDSESVYIGSNAGNINHTDATENIGIGHAALDALTTGDYNVAVGGTLTLSKLETGNGNIAFGSRSGSNQTSGTNNMYIGSNSGRQNITGSSNVYIGGESGYGTSTKSQSNNTFIGYRSGRFIDTGSSNIFIGHYAGYGQTTNGNRLIIDNQERTDAAEELTNSILYGVMDAIPASQSLRVNASFDVYGITQLNPGLSDFDTIISGDNEANLLRVDAGTDTVRLGDWDTNYASFNTSGDLTFVGNGDTITGPGAGGLTVTNASGNLTLSTTTSGDLTLTKADDLIFTGFDCTVYNNGGALTADVSGVISCSNDDSGGGGAGGMWQENSGAISPLNNTWDVLIGSTASTSADFAFLNVNSGVPTASFSGNLVLNSAGVIQTTLNQALTIGGNTTGDISLVENVTITGTLDPANVAAFTLTGNITGSGAPSISGINSLSATTLTDGVATINSGVGTGFNSLTVDNLTLNGSTISSTNDILLTPTGGQIQLDGGLVNVGNGNTFVLADGDNDLGVVGDLEVQAAASISGTLTLYSVPQLQSTALQSLILGGSTTGNVLLQPNADTGDYFQFTSDGADLTLATTDSSNLSLAPAGSLIFSGFDCTVYNNGGALIADASGIISCSDDTGGMWQENSGAISPLNNTWDVLIGATATASAKFAFLNVDTDTPTASISANSGDNATFLTGTGNLGTTNMQTLILGGASTGDILFQPSGDTDDYLRLYTSGNVPYLATVGSTDLVLNPDGGEVGFGGTTYYINTSGIASLNYISLQSGETISNAADTELVFSDGTNDLTLDLNSGSGYPAFRSDSDSAIGFLDTLYVIDKAIEIFGSGGTNNLKLYHDDTDAIIETVAAGDIILSPLDNYHVTIENDGGGDSIFQIDQLGSGDIMAASVSGTTRFKIDTEGYTYSQRFSDIADSDYYIDPASGDTSLSLAGDIDTSNQTSDWILNAAVDALNFDSNTLSIDASGHKIGIGNNAPGQELDVTGNITLSGNIMGDSTDSLKLQAGGVTPGSTGTSSIYFLDSSGNTKGRYDTLGKFGDGSDGDITIDGDGPLTCTDGTCICDTEDIDGDSDPDCAASHVTATATAGQSTITVALTTAKFAAGDEVVIIQMLGTGEGNYETKHILNVDSTTVLHFNEGLKNTYTDGGSNAAQVVRIPQYDDVTIQDGGILTVSPWNGSDGGVLFFRATGTVDLTAVGANKIHADVTGAVGGASQTGGGGAAQSVCVGLGGVNGTDGTAGTTGATGTGAGGGGEGGAPTPGIKGLASIPTTTAGGGGGGASGGGGAGGSHGSSASAPTAGANGGAGGTAQAGAGGTAGTAGSAGSSQGNSAFSVLFTGSGGGSGASGSGGGSGACGALGSSSCTGGAGGGGATSGVGGIGGGIVFIAGNTITNSGTISADGGAGGAGATGNNGSAGAAGAGSYAAAGGGGGGSSGSGGGGAGGTVWLISDSLTAGTVNVDGEAGGATATGGNGGGCADNLGYTVGGGGGGGKGGTGGNAGTCGEGNEGVNGDASATGVGSAGSTGRTLQTTTNNYGTLYAGAINTVSADLAEYYTAADPNLEPGDIVMVGPGSSTTVTNPDGSVEIIHSPGALYKSTSPYQPDLIGIVSSEPGIILGSRDNQSTASMRTVALIGRVPVKISPDSPPILIGDLLTSSSHPGQAAKATLPGPIIGKALEPWTPDSHKTHILTFINLTWHDPGIYLTDIGELEILADQQASSHSYQLVSPSSDIIQRLAAYSEAIIAQIKAGFIQAQEIITQTLIANDKIIAPTVESETLVTNFISPLTDGQITIAADTTITGHLDVQTASIAGRLQAQEVIADRVVTNELIASKIKASTIEGLRDKIVNLVDQYRQDTAVVEEPDPPQASISALLAQLEKPAAPASPSGHLDLASINADFGFFSDYLAVMGTATITDLKVTNTLSINNQLLLASNSISTLDDTLYLQPSGLGAINFLAGLMILDESGNVTINGDLTVTGVAQLNQVNTNILVASQINTPQLSPLRINIATQSAVSLYSNIGQVASIDASGSAHFSQLSLDASGTATISAGTNHIEVNSHKLTPQSQVILTFNSNYAPATKYWVVKQADQHQFNIFVNYPVNKPTLVDWLIIN